MIIRNNTNIEIIQGSSYGDTVTDWRLENTNTGIFNILNSSSANANLSIITNGNIGIGTIPITTSSKLEIIGDVNISGNYKKNNRDVISETSNYVLSTSNNIISFSNVKGNWKTFNNIIYYNTSNVGIGTTNPISKLNIYNNPIETILTIQNNFIEIIPTEGVYIRGTISSTDKYIIFTNGTSKFTVPVGGINCDIFMIGAGGGGSYFAGGGAGALIATINQILPEGNCVVVVGIGSVSGLQGGESSISVNGTIRYCAKGGGKGANDTGTGYDGGCGGGGGYISGGTINAGGAAVESTVVNSTGTIINSWRSTNGATLNYAVYSWSGGRANGGNQEGGCGGGTGETASATQGGNGIYLANINGTNYNLRTYFANNTTFGVQNGTTGNYYIGGGGGAYNNTTSGFRNGGLGGAVRGGGTGEGAENTGSGGTYLRKGGSGLVIIRYRIAPLTSSSSIELIRGSNNDSNRDYKIGNYVGDFIIKSSLSGTDTDSIKITGTTGIITNPTGTATWTTASDKRIKENIERASYDKCYECINKLELNRFNYIKGFNTVNRDITQLGFIAQEVKEIFPKSVFTNSYINDTINIPDLHSIDITQINYSLYGTVKKLIERVNNNKNNIKYLKSILNIDTISTSNLILDKIL